MTMVESRTELFLTPLDLVDQSQCIEIITKYNLNDFNYIVTPNTDHVIRINNTPQLNVVYNSALLSLCDSRIIKILARFCSVKIPQVIPGSDLTRILFEEIITQKDRITVIGSDLRSINKLKDNYKLKNIYHYNPPMGFIHDEVEVNKCIDFVHNHPSRFIFIAVGSPQQEILANQIFIRGASVGLGFCIGASINFLTGSEKRAPKFIQNLALEWLFRLLQNPKRLWKRYLVQDTKIFPIFFRCLRQKLME